MVRAYLGILRNKNSEGCALADIGSILSPLWTRTGTWGMYPCTFVSTIYFVHEESSEIAIWRYRCFSDIFSLEVQDHVYKYYLFCMRNIFLRYGYTRK